MTRRFSLPYSLTSEPSPNYLQDKSNAFCSQDLDHGAFLMQIPSGDTKRDMWLSLVRRRVQIDVSHMAKDADLDHAPASVDNNKTKQPTPCSKFEKTEQHPVNKRPLIFIENQHPRKFVHTSILRTSRQIYNEALPFLLERICLSYTPWHCLSAKEQHDGRFSFPVRHLALIEHLRLTFNRRAKHLDPHTVIEVIHHFSPSHHSLKRLDLRFNSSPESEHSPVWNRV